MSFLTKAKSAMNKAKSADLHPKAGLVHEVVDTAVGMGSSFLLGEVHGRYREAADVKGVPLTLLVGLVGKGAALAGHVFGVGGSVLPYASTVGNAGLYAYAFSHGVSHGTEAAGRSVLLFDKGAAVPSLPGASRTTVLGEIPPPPRGTYVSPAEIANFASRAAS